MGTITLNNGIKMPILGYGVYMVDPSFLRAGQREREGVTPSHEAGLSWPHAYPLADGEWLGHLAGIWRPGWTTP